MNSNEYLEKVKHTDRDNYKEISDRLNVDNLKLFHACMGMAGEVGEICDAFKKHIMYGKTLDVNNLKEECGDVLWYMGVMIRALGTSFEEVMQMNHDKLKKRYPEGFTEEHAIKRLDKLDEKK